MAKLTNILKGWGNYVFPKKEVEQLAKARAEICARCPHAEKGKYEVIREGRIREIAGMICSLCACPLSTKLRSPEETCPINRW